MVPGFSSGTSPARNNNYQQLEGNGALMVHSNPHMAAVKDRRDNSANNKQLPASEFQFKSYAAVRTIIYQAHAIRNQFII